MVSRLLSVVLFVVCASAMLSPGEAASGVSTDLTGCAVATNAVCPNDAYIVFNLFTRLNAATAQIITMATDNLASTNFRASKPTKVIIHGWVGSPSDLDQVNMKNQLLLSGDCNVIMADWSKLCAGLQCYLQSKGNTPHVGACVAGLVTRLRGAGAVDIHVIGHSLGAQIAGIAGHALKPNLLPRITGLDPAGPGYDVTSAASRIDATDAKYVEILHTNIYELGYAWPAGHVDYYFNGGTFQPGCPIVNPAGRYIACSHFRAVDFYSESLTSVKGFYGWQCLSFTLYTSGFCLPTTRSLLLGDSRNRGVVSIPTASASPFALGK